MSNCNLTFGETELTTELKSFCLFWQFKINAHRQVVDVKTPYLLTHFSKPSRSSPIKKPIIEGDYKPLKIDGGNGEVIFMNKANCQHSLKWEYRNEMNQLHFFHAADTTEQPYSWMKFNESEQIVNIDVPAKGNCPTIIHNVKVGENDRVAYAVFEKEDISGTESLGIVFPLYRNPVLADILAISPMDGKTLKKYFPTISINRKLKGVVGQVTTAVTECDNVNFLTNAHASTSEGFILIAQGNFKNIPLNHDTFKTLYNRTFYSQPEDFVAYFSSLAQGNEDNGSRTLENIHNDEISTVTQGSNKLPIELFFINNLNYGMNDKLKPYI